MKILPNENLPEFSLPLKIYASVNIADAIGKDGEEFDVFVGLEKKYAEQLHEYSLDKGDVELQSFTGDFKRFGSGSYEEWYKKNRTIFSMIHKQTDRLAAIVWFGPKSLGKKSVKFGKEDKDEFEATWHTVSIRSYPPFRGKGLMKNFVAFAIDLYKRHFLNIKFWSGMDDRNLGIRKLLSELEFIEDAEKSDLANNWLIMTRS